VKYDTPKLPELIVNSPVLCGGGGGRRAAVVLCLSFLGRRKHVLFAFH
jgi:hypothetical protein